MEIKDIDSIFDIGGPNTDYAKYFKGNSYLKMLSTDQISIGNVTFEPGCRNNRHIHHAKSGGGQILLVTYGEGYYQEWGKKARKLLPGDVVNIPPNTKHRHGASSNSFFQHLSIEVPGEETSNERCEEVSDDEYEKAQGED